MRKAKFIFYKLILLALVPAVMLSAYPAAAASETPSVVVLNCDDDAGDYAFFDSDYCYTSGDPKYTNMSSGVGDNLLECYRLDYTNPKRKNYIYMERTQPEDPCYFDITLTRGGFTRNTGKIYSNVLINADIRRTVPGADAQLFKLTGGAAYGDNSSVFTAATLKADGTLEFYDGSSYDTGMKNSSWYNYKIALDLAAHTADIYFEGEKIKSDMQIPAGMSRLNVVNFALDTGATGDFYLDNLRVVGLIEPYVDGVETPTSVFPAETQVRAYMADKVGFHAYGNLLCKDNIKTVISPSVIYDRDNSELYVDTDTLRRAFDLGSITVNKNTVVIPGRTAKVKSQPKIADGVVYLPLTEFADVLLGKYTFVHQTGMFVVSDINHTVKGDNWTYQSFRADSSQVTPMNDIDHLNAYLQYERPTAETLMNDYISYTGDSDFTQHPRLLATKADFEYLKAKVETDDYYKSIYNSTLTKAQGYLSSSPVAYQFEDAMRAMNPANTMLTRFMHWGYAYNMTGDTKYAERAFKEIEAAAKFPDYNTSHIIDTGTYVMALAIGYDWFYNGFTQEQREFAAKVCHEQALKVLASGMYGRLTSTSAGTNMWGAFRWRSNYNSIIAGGVINAALATAEVDPEYCFEIISLGLRSIEYSLLELMPGGGWNEAPGYWNYAMQFFNYAFASMNGNFGTDYGITKSMGMESTLKYAIATLGSYGNNNFHDSGVSIGTNSYSAFAYLARHFKDKAAFDMRIADIKSRRASAGMEDILYYKPELYADSQTSAGTVNYVEGIELFSVRDSLDADESEFFFSTHFGTTSGYHQHTDTSAFVLDMYDIRWADDLGSENYNLQNEQGYGDADLYRKRGEGHNIIVINPAKYGPTSYVNGMPKGATKEQVNNRFIPIERREYDDSQAIVTADMTDAYSDVDSMQTGYFVDRDKQTVTMRSEFELKDESEIYWFMHTSADISIDGDTAVLSKGGKKIKIQVHTNAKEYELLNMAAQPLPTSPQVPGQNANSGYRKLAVRMNTDDYTTLTVRISPEDDEEQISTQPISQWRLDSVQQDESVSLISAADHAAMGSYAVAAGEEVTGTAGKAADDESMRFSSANTVMSFDIGDAQLKKYVVMSANVMTKDANTKLHYGWGSAMINDYPLLELNRWNQVKVVADTAAGKAVTIVNGKAGEWYDCSYDGTVFTIGVDGDGASTLYTDDISIETMGDYIESGYPTLGMVFDVSDGYINAEEGMTAEYIARRSELPYVAVYADSSCTEQLPDDVQVIEGNAIVAGDGKNTVMYIVGSVEPAVTGNITWIASASDSFGSGAYSISRATSTTAYGIGGKQPWDGVWEFEYMSNTYNESDAFFQKSLTESQAAGTVAFTMDIYPTDTMYKFMVATGGHRAISKMVEVPTQLRNRWNRLEYVYHGDTATAQVYINGELTETRQNVVLSSNIIRFIAYVTDKTAESVLYMDNVNLYAGDVNLNPVSSDKYTVETNSITVGGGQTVYDILLNLKKAFDRYDIWVYNEIGGVALNRDEADSTMTIVVKDNNNVVKQYSVK